MSNNPKPEWWRPVWICLAGEQALPNITPLLPFLPEKVYYLHTEMKASASAANNCKKFLEAKYGKDKIKVINIQTSPNNFQIIRDTVNKIVYKEGFDEILLNWTGGTKPMSFAALLSDLKVQNIYFDSRFGLSVNFSEPDTSFFDSIPTLSIQDLIQINTGLDIKNIVMDKPNGVYAPSTDNLFFRVWSGEYLNFKPLDLPEKIRAFFGRNEVKSLNNKDRKFGEPVFLDANKILHNPFSGCEFENELVSCMAKDDLLIDKNAFIPTSKGLIYLNGFWWENLVVALLQSAIEKSGKISPGEEFAKSLKIIWKHGDKYNISDCEIDYVFKNRDQLYLVSCTTASKGIAEDHRHQIESFTEHLGGRFCRAMLATTLSDADYDWVAARKGANLYMPRLKEWKNPGKILDAFLKQ